MKLKTKSILNVVDAHGKAVLKMDRASGLIQLTITKRGNDYLVGEHPDGKIYKTDQKLLALQLDDFAMFINSWA